MEVVRVTQSEKMEKLIIRNVRPPDIEREIIVDYNCNVIRIEFSITF